MRQALHQGGERHQVPNESCRSSGCSCTRCFATAVTHQCRRGPHEFPAMGHHPRGATGPTRTTEQEEEDGHDDLRPYVIGRTLRAVSNHLRGSIGVRNCTGQLYPSVYSPSRGATRSAFSGRASSQASENAPHIQCCRLAKRGGHSTNRSRTGSAAQGLTRRRCGGLRQ